MPDASDATRSIGRICCTCVHCYVDEVDGRLLYRCDAEDGGWVSMKRRACELYRRASALAIYAKLHHNAYTYKVGCRCRECTMAHAEQETRNRASKKSRPGMTREGRPYEREDRNR